MAQLQKENEQMKQQLRQAQLSPFGTARIVAGQSLVPTGSTGVRIQVGRSLKRWVWGPGESAYPPVIV